MISPIVKARLARVKRAFRAVRDASRFERHTTATELSEALKAFSHWIARNGSQFAPRLPVTIAFADAWKAYQEAPGLSEDPDAAPDLRAAFLAAYGPFAEAWRE